MSRRMATLEGALGVKLFMRGRDGVTRTEEGVARRVVDLSRREADVALRLRPPGHVVAEPSAIAVKLADIGFALYGRRGARTLIRYPGFAPGAHTAEACGHSYGGTFRRLPVADVRNNQVRRYCRRIMPLDVGDRDRRYTFAAVSALALLGGCLPILVPPVHGRLGAGRATPKVPRTDYDGNRVLTSELATFSAGIDSAALNNEPYSVEGGFTTDWVHPGLYIEGGPLFRFSPHGRIGTSAGAEAWLGGANGGGAKLSITLEYVGAYKREGGASYAPGTDGTHNASTTYSLRSGAFAIGAFVDVGHRWMGDEPNYTYFLAGLSFRLAAMLGIVDLSKQH